MPIVHIHLRSGKPDAYRREVADGVYNALVATFNVPENDRFITISERDGVNFDFDRTYPGIHRGPDFIIVQITASNTRTIEQKKALYAAIVRNLEERPGVRPEDVMIGLTEVAKENWSFGNGIAQYA